MNLQALTYKLLIVLFITFFYCASVYSNIFKTTVIRKSEGVSDNGILGLYVIDSHLQAFDKNVDTDNDGDLDIIRIKSNQNSSALSVIHLINEGNNVFKPTFSELPNINFLSQEHIKLIDVYVNDLNNDGLIDIWFYTQSQVDACQYHIEASYIYKNMGSNQFELAHSFYYESFLNEFNNRRVPSINFSDTNSDGLLDPTIDNLQFHRSTPAKIKLTNNGGFNFNLNKESMLPYITDVKTLNYDSDIHQDFITLSSIPEHCHIQTTATNMAKKMHGLLWKGEGKGAFRALEENILTSNPTHVAVADVNADNFSDILLTHENTNEEKTTVLYFGDEQNSYRHSFVFNDILTLVKFADMDNDGLLDVVALTEGTNAQLLIYRNLGYDQFDLEYLFPVENNNGELFLADMDKDGHMDIIMNTKLNENNIHVYYYSHSKYIDKVVADIQATSIGITDFDFDGYPDILVQTEVPVRYHPILKNMANRHFAEISYDDVFLSFGLRNRTNYQFQSLLFEDMDNDGRDDFFGISREHLYGYSFFKVRVLMHDNDDQIKYHNNTDILAQFYDENIYQKNNVAMDFADFNNDGLKDIIVAGGDEIKILTQTQNPVIEDIYFDPQHVGHGFSIEKAGKDNLYYTLFYTYDDSGNSEWYLQLNKMLAENKQISLYSPPAPIQKGQSDGNLISFNYDYITQTTRPNTSGDKVGFIESHSEDDETMSLDFVINGSDRHVWKSQRLTGNNKPTDNFSGLWWAGSQDSGWGLSLNFIQRTDRVDVFAILFFYDALGDARWLLGHAENFVPSQEITLEMEMFNGYGRDQKTVEITTVPAGSITLNLHKASQDLTQSGTMSMNVFYPKGQRQDWIRKNIPFALFSKPRMKNSK